MCKLLRRYRRLTTSICLIFALPLLIWLATATWRVVNFHPEPHGGIATLLDTRGRLITTLGARRQPFLPYQNIPQIIRTAIVEAMRNDIGLQNVPVILVTGAVPSVHDYPPEGSYQDIIGKPFDVMDVLQKVNQLVQPA